MRRMISGSKIRIVDGLPFQPRVRCPCPAHRLGRCKLTNQNRTEREALGYSRWSASGLTGVWARKHRDAIFDAFAARKPSHDGPPHEGRFLRRLRPTQLTR